MPTDSALVRVVAPRSPTSPMVLTCEHASRELPNGVSWPEADRWLAGTHWACDFGAAELTHELATLLGAAAVLAGFSRLWIDPNRPLDSATLLRDVADGKVIALNHRLDALERERRLEAWHAYHDAAHALLDGTVAPIALAVHSFTPTYEGTRRSVELGVLFDEEEALAVRLAERLAALGFDTRLNEPYSGRDGLIYAIGRHATSHKKRALELEVRQDLATDPSVRASLVVALAEFGHDVARELAGGAA